MALERTARPLAKCFQCARNDKLVLAIRSFSTTSPSQLDTELQTQSSPPPPPPTTSKPRTINPDTVSSPRLERKLVRETGKLPVGSRRRRVALKQSAGIPFEQLPYQCFQEARKVLQEDRKEKVEQIRVQRERIQRLKEQKVEPQDESRKEHRLESMRRNMEELKILADINDPLVKKRYEDGNGDMNKPIYRYLADRQWREYKRKVLMQRITQMTVVPDVLQHVDPVVSTALSFGRRKVPHGEIVDSRVSEIPPRLIVQPYDKGERLVTIAVVNPDVPNVAKDSFDYRCHFLASNIRLSPTTTHIRFEKLDEESQVIIPWLPAFSQKGLPYQRMSIFIMEQSAKEADVETNGSANGSQTLDVEVVGSTNRSQTLDVKAIKEAGRFTKRHNFILRAFNDRYRLKPVGVDLFRTKYDEGTAGVMQRAGIVGGDVEFKRKRIEPLPYKKLPGSRYR